MREIAMSNEHDLTQKTHLTQKFEEERVRTQEQSQIANLQGQIDELRRLIKDQTNKYQWAMEQVRKVEGTIPQIQLSFDHHTSEVNQTIDRSRRDVLDLRKEVATAMVKIQEGVEPIRQMQAQIQQVADAQKQDRDHTVSWLTRIEESEKRIGELQSQIKETDERHRQLLLQLTQLRDADAQTLQDIRRVSEDLQAEKQSLRRQAVEAQQLVVEVRNVQEEQDARINRIDEIRQNVELFAEQVPDQITEISSKFPDIYQEIRRVERVSTERFLMSQERIEEMRRQADEKLADLQVKEEQHTYEHTSWLERIDGMLFQLEQRIIRDVNQLEEIQRYQSTLIQGIEERELQVIANVSGIFQQQIDLVKNAQAEIHKKPE
jgi:chromosome segregation ATPase